MATYEIKAEGVAVGQQVTLNSQGYVVGMDLAGPNSVSVGVVLQVVNGTTILLQTPGVDGEALVEPGASWNANYLGTPPDWEPPATKPSPWSSDEDGSRWDEL